MTNANENENKPNKGNPQLTGQFWDPPGNHLWQALDGGWKSKFWARVRSEAVILSALAVDTPFWIMFRIDHKTEVSFTKFLERIYKKKHVPSRYIVIRAKSLARRNDFDSWFFISGLEVDAIAERAAKYSDAKPELITSEELKQVVKILFDIDMHPHVPNIRRWSASRAMRHDLTLNRMRYLIHLAREGEDHELTRPLPPLMPFEKKLARYIVHDRPLMFNLRLGAILSLLLETKELTDDEVIDVMKELSGREPWKMVDAYKGLPNAGAKLDEADERFSVLKQKGKLSAFSERLDGATEPELRCETIVRPEPEEGYLE